MTGGTDRRIHHLCFITQSQQRVAGKAAEHSQGHFSSPLLLQQHLVGKLEPGSGCVRHCRAMSHRPFSLLLFFASGADVVARQWTDGPESIAAIDVCDSSASTVTGTQFWAAAGSPPSSAAQPECRLLPTQAVQAVAVMLPVTWDCPGATSHHSCGSTEQDQLICPFQPRSGSARICFFLFTLNNSQQSGNFFSKKNVSLALYDLFGA